MLEYMMIGEVLRPQGVKGEAKVKPYAADVDAFRTWKQLYIKSGSTYAPVSFKCTRIHDGFVYMILEGCQNPDDVEKFRGTQLYIDRAHAAALEEDEVYISDLIGCAAIDETGKEIGVVKDVLQHGPVDVYVFSTPKGSMMAPALKAVFPAVHVAEKRMDVVSKALEEVAVFEN
ncbi:MAG: ribosome maturation factor RimM [Clostridia bacterium]|nr:ribosome maturation factor RimM [Clostridia bacterium]